MKWLDRVQVKYRGDRKVAALYGLILYTHEHAHVKKALRDEDYWKSLDEISGRRLGIFAIRPRSRARQPDDELGFTVSIGSEPHENKKLLEELGIDANIRLPAIAWLARHQRKVLCRLVELDDSSEKAAFTSMKKAIATAARAVNGVKRSNLKKPLGVFGAVSFAVSHDTDVQRLKGALNLWARLRELLG